MVEIKELQKQEIKQLENEEAIELEQLILQGANANIPIEINFPVYKDDHVEYVQVGAFIKPLTNKESTLAYARGLKSKTSTPNTELVKIGLYDKNMNHLKPELVEKMPSGIIDAITKQIMDVSGIKIDKDEQADLVRRLMDF